MSIETDMLYAESMAEPGVDRPLNRGRRRRLKWRGKPPSGAMLVGAAAVGAACMGAVAVGAVAIGAVSIGRLRIGRLVVDELVVRKS